MRARIPLSSVRILLLVVLASVVVIVGTCSRAPAVAASLDQAAAQTPQGQAGAQTPPAQAAPAPAPNPNLRHATFTPVNGKGGQEVSGPYEAVKDWPRPVIEGWTINAETIFVESPDRVIAVGRGIRQNPWPNYWGPATIRALGHMFTDETRKRQYMVVVYDRAGKLVETWDQWIPVLPDVQLVQANPYDPDHHVWIATGVSLVKLSNDGKRHVDTLDAQDVPQAPGQKPRFVVEHFAWASNGDLYASGGYQITRFSKDGKFLSAFGKPGSGPGEFGIVGPGNAGGGIHGVVIDSPRNRLYVADRVNSRVQVFDLNGKHLDTWPNMPAPYCIRLTADGRYLWVGDGYTQKLAKYDAMTGALVRGSTWGTMGIAPGAFWGLHFFTTDSEGSLYIGEDMAFRIQKLVPRKDGNPAQLIGPLM